MICIISLVLSLAGNYVTFWLRLLLLFVVVVVVVVDDDVFVVAAAGAVVTFVVDYDQHVFAATIE